ncbi:MAG: hypothetical protein ACLRM8_02150 [Alistipes sp.]
MPTVSCPTTHTTNTPSRSATTTSFLQDRMTLDEASATWRPKTRTSSLGRTLFNPLTSLYTYRGSVGDLDDVRDLDSNKTRRAELGVGPRHRTCEPLVDDAPQASEQQAAALRVLNAGLTYKVTDWRLTLAGRAKADLSVGESSRKLYASMRPAVRRRRQRILRIHQREDTHRYGDFIAAVNKHWEQFSLFANVGASISDQLSASPERAVRSNALLLRPTPTPTAHRANRLQERKREQEQAVFASVEAGWRACSTSPRSATNGIRIRPTRTACRTASPRSAFRA